MTTDPPSASRLNERMGEQFWDCLPQDAPDDGEAVRDILGEVARVVLGEAARMVLGGMACFMAGDAARFVIGDVFPFAPKDKGDATRVGDGGFVIGVVDVDVGVKVRGGGRERDCDGGPLGAVPFDENEAGFIGGDDTRALVGGLDGPLIGDVTRALLGDVDNDRPVGVVGVATLRGVFISSSSSSSIGISTPFTTMIFRLRL